MQKTRAFLKSIGMPEGDAYHLPTSEKRFADGAQYRFEVPGIQGPKVMEALLEAMDQYGIALHRVTQTKGIMMLTDQEIMEMVRLSKQAQTDLILAIGPRATTDTVDVIVITTVKHFIKRYRKNFRMSANFCTIRKMNITIL